MAKKTIIVFEDIKGERKKLESAFGKVFNQSARVITFEPPNVNALSETPKTYEKMIEEYLNNKKIVIKNIGLIITDRDLSQYEQWGGLSEASVSKFANIHAIPICLYAREDLDFQPQGRMSEIIKWSDYKIVLNIKDGPSAIAKQCRIIFNGFETIRNKFPAAMKKKPKSPAEIMSHILDKPELQDRIALYGTGDQHILEDILPYSEDEIKMRMPRMLGYWLWDSILRYPGILVYEKAAASYLNIDPDQFKNKGIRELFKKALYTGPFSQMRDYWWRDVLDEIVSKAHCSDGYEYARKYKKRVNECKCYFDKNKNIKAGYYCMLNDEPVSDQNSKSNISWFPSGADLARIAKDDFEKIAPWIAF